MNFFDHIESIIGKDEKEKLELAIEKEQIKCFRVNTMYLDIENIKKYQEQKKLG